MHLVSFGIIYGFRVWGTSFYPMLRFGYLVLTLHPGDRIRVTVAWSHQTGI
jgi:hypothetical protein